MWALSLEAKLISDFPGDETQAALCLKYFLGFLTLDIYVISVSVICMFTLTESSVK